ncbi:MAG: hypothetical protein MUC91_13585, partial [Verrucomicrobia bacterium]|nr:hypothetical protein [Verrucomicrobiota bacterium]
FAGYQWNTNGPTLSAAMRGTKLYVATRSPGNSGPNDHFMLITDSLLPSASAAAPWAKAGQVSVASTKPFVGAESQNSYAGWFNAPGGSALAKSSSASGMLEAVIDLEAAFGTVPEVVYVAAAAYSTGDGGSLNAIAPTGSGPHLDPGEFLALPTAALHDDNADGLYDRLDPNLGFRITRVRKEGNAAIIDWNTMPGRRYEVLASGSPATDWNSLSGSTNTAGPLDLELSHTNIAAPSVLQHYYRIRLLP